jgi:spermidine/putrescine transport system permease protein
VEQHLRTDSDGVDTSDPPIRHGKKWGSRLAPYGLILPGGLWLLIFFLIPMIAMLSLSTQTGSVDTGYSQTFHFGIFNQAFHLYGKFFTRSLVYGTMVTLITFVVSYPLAYWIAFYGGRRKTTYLLLILLPFFVSFVIRTFAWKFILSDDGLVLGFFKRIHLMPQTFHVLATPTAVVAGISYNLLPFMALPLYVALEKIDRSVVAASGDLYGNRRQTFLKVILPLSLPGVFAGVLLTFVPAVGDYVNATILGGPNTTMVGNIIQNKFLLDQDYSMASALSVILMIGMVLGIFIYAKVLGTRSVEEYI